MAINNDAVAVFEFILNHYEIVFLYGFKYLSDFNKRFSELNQRLLGLEAIEKARAEHYRMVHREL